MIMIMIPASWAHVVLQPQATARRQREPEKPVKTTGRATVNVALVIMIMINFKLNFTGKFKFKSTQADSELFKTPRLHRDNVACAA